MLVLLYCYRFGSKYNHSVVEGVVEEIVSKDGNKYSKETVKCKCHQQ